MGYPGLVILAATVTLACLKTAVGLITSCAETFSALFPHGPAYRVWAALFAVISFLFANLGLSSIITFSVPVLMFLYPLSITLILLALCGKLFHHDRAVYNWVIGCTLVASVYDLLRSLPDTLRAACHLDGLLDAVGGVLPLAKAGLVGSARPFSVSSSASSSISRKSPAQIEPEKPHPPSWMRFYLFCSDLGEQRLRAAQSVDRRGRDAPGHSPAPSPQG